MDFTSVVELGQCIFRLMDHHHAELTWQAKDIMFYLYNVARANIAKSVPKEIRIIRHLLSIEDPRERFEEMTNAFSPGDELEGKDEDGLYT